MKHIEDSYPLSPMQQGMLFHSLYASQSGVYIQQLICALHQDLNVPAFKRAWQRIVQRHPVLRTSFRWEGVNAPLQEVHRHVRLPVEEQDWRDVSARQWGNRLEAYLEADRRRGFELTEAPLMRLALLRIAEADYQFIWTSHHALLDGRSRLLVINELFALYEAFCQGQDLQLKQSRPYRDHIDWLRKQDFTKAESFWRRMLNGFTAPTPLVVDRAHYATSDQEKGYGTQGIRLSETLTSALQSLAQQQQLTPNTLLQGAWALLLGRYSGAEEVVFGATRAGRRSTLEGAEPMVGLFINTLPIRIRLSSDTVLLPWLKELRAQWNAIRPYEHTPLGKIQGWSDMPAGKQLFESIVVFENYLLNSALRAQGGSWENREFRLLGSTNYPLTVTGYLEPALLLEIAYDRCRFDDATIARMLGHCQILLEGMVTNPEQRLVDLPLLTAKERQQLLVVWNDTATDYPQDQCIHQLFEAQVERAPDAVAVVFEDAQLTYRELNQQANQLAHHLKSLGVGPGVCVAIYMERSVEMIPALLGILKAGGAYVPLETALPEARIQWILASLNINCMITQSAHLQTMRDLKQQLPTLQHLICLDTPQRPKTLAGEVMAECAASKQCWTHAHLGQLAQEDLPVQASPDDTAYIIFTSGSTGIPKGVMVRHKPVINLINWVNSTFGVDASDRVLLVASLCFDLSVYDVFGLLAAGGSIRVVSDRDVRDPERLLRILGDEPITFWDSAPAVLQQLVPFFSSMPSMQRKGQLRLVFLSGDWIPVALPDLVRTAFPSAAVISLGGATEATVWSNYYFIGDVHPLWVSIPYGKPIQNAQYYLLDASLNPCPIGVPGELYIGGACLSSGYVNAPGLTAEKFIPHPFREEPGARLYKTGDRARYLPDGNIEFLGRLDQQVKLRGFRIELGEIEAVLGQHPAVRESVVLAREDRPGDKRLVAYIVSRAKQAPSSSELRRFLQVKLPDYMIPAAFVRLDTWPLTPNGKVDHKELPAPDGVRPDLEIFVAPRTPVEQVLAGVWSQLLRVEQVGVHDNFFALGGDSILSIQMVARATQAGLRLTPKHIFQHQTIVELAAVADTTQALEAEQGLVMASLPRTPIQHWFYGFTHALRSCIAHYLSLKAGGYTPSDFPRAQLNQKDFDKVIASIGQTAKRSDR